MLVFRRSRPFIEQWTLLRRAVSTESSPATPSSEFQYSLNHNNALTHEQQQFYEDNGFLVIRNCVPKDNIAMYRDRLGEICNDGVRVPDVAVMKNVSFAKVKETSIRTVDRILNFQNDPILFQYSFLPEITKYVSSLIGPNLVSIHRMMFNKPPDSGNQTSRQPLHQDSYYFPVRPRRKLLGAWTALEKSHRDNGCLVVIAGTHKGELLEHGYPDDWGDQVNKLFHGINSYNPNMELHHVEMEEGDTMFFHSALVHGSGVNRTKGFRKAIACHYAAGESHYIDVKGTPMEEVGREALNMFKKMKGMGEDVKLEYTDIWKFRSRHICGKNSNL